MNIFGGMKILWIFFWGHPKIGLVFGLQEFQIFFGVLEISDIFWG